MLTIGHSTLPLDTFLHILEENGVGALADIRGIPKSRHNPQFAQEALSSALAAAGIAYQWMPSLGGRRKPRDNWEGGVPLNAGWLNPSFRGYADYMTTAEFSSAIDALLALARRRSTVLLCAEAVPWRCHRSLVADALLVRGCAVEHILFDKRGAGKRRPHRLTPFARVEGTRLWYPPADSPSLDAPPCPFDPGRV